MALTRENLEKCAPVSNFREWVLQIQISQNDSIYNPSSIYIPTSFIYNPTLEPSLLGAGPDRLSKMLEPWRPRILSPCPTPLQSWTNQTVKYGTVPKYPKCKWMALALRSCCLRDGGGVRTDLHPRRGRPILLCACHVAFILHALRFTFRLIRGGDSSGKAAQIAM